MAENIASFYDALRLDQRMSNFSGTTASRLDEEFSDSWKQEDADVTFVGPDGLMIAVETKVDSTRRNDSLVWWSALQNKAWSDRARFWMYFNCQQNLSNHLAVVLSCSSVSELARDLGHYGSLASAYENVARTLTVTNLEAVHPTTRTAYMSLSDLPVSPITKSAIRAILHEFADVLAKQKTAEWPPLRLVTLEDSSYLLEWTFLDRRLGFSFEADPKDSGWYYVYSHESSERYESGTMDQLEMRRLIRMMLKS